MRRGLDALRSATPRDPAVGCFVFSRDAGVTDLAGHAGLDFVIVDMEHAALGYSDVGAHVRASYRTGIAVLVRIPASDPGLASRLLDLGVAGLVIPHFGMDPDGDRRLFEGVRYAPEGRRAACSGVPAAAYGLEPFAQVAAAANRDLFLMPQIEDAEIVPRVEELLGQYRVDALMPGPSDLAASYGAPGQFDHPRVLQALASVAGAARAKRIALAHYLVDAPAAAGAERPTDAAVLVYSIDFRILGRALREAVRALRPKSREGE